MPKPREPLKAFVTSQYVEDRYHKEYSERRVEAMGASPLVLRMYRKESDV